MVLIVFVTVPPRAAKRLARVLLKERVCACVNILPAVESLYWWRGKIDAGKESLLIVKTKKSSFEKLRRTVVKNHPYDVPEVVGVPVARIFKPYRDWVVKEVTG